ncbi:MAG: aldo/keto reductase [Elusimicrobia bacterium]|nr:aldo/keto reductase [Elusimicrobiota bacterium]
MKYRKIPNTDLEVSAVGLGTWPFSEEMWGPTDEKACLKTIDESLACGVNLIDMAPVYGWGRAEEITGKAIKGKRDKVVLATKCGLTKTAKGVKINLNTDSIKKELEESLKKLGTDRIDLYQLHWPDPKTPLEETLGIMAGFVKKGKVRYIGVCNFSLELLKKARQIAPVKTVQNEFSLLKQKDAQDMLPFCKEAGVGYLAYGCLAGGILTGKYDSPADFPPSDARSFFYRHYRGEGFKKAEKIVQDLRAAGEKRDATASQMAIAWALGQSGITCALVGAKNPQQTRANAESADLELPVTITAGP